ncbi:MAG: hypothetical protein ACLURV_02190 [Gallintestinimicrobium sp.]
MECKGWMSFTEANHDVNMLYVYPYLKQRIWKPRALFLTKTATVSRVLHDNLKK